MKKNEKQNGATAFPPSTLSSQGEVNVSNEQGKKYHIRISELDGMSQYLLKKNSQGIRYGITCGILSFLLQCAKKVGLPARHLRFQIERRKEWKKSWLHLQITNGALYSDRVKLLQNAQAHGTGENQGGSDE